jgi:hypothetical protein
MHEAAISLMAIAETRHKGYVDVPPSELTPEVYEDLIKCGHAVSRSDHLWMDGWRVYSPRAVRAGFYRACVPQSIYTRIASPDVRIPDLAEIEDMQEAEVTAENLNGMREKLHMD